MDSESLEEKCIRYSSFTSDELLEIIFQDNYDNLEKSGYLEITIERVYRCTADFYRILNNLTQHIIDADNQANALGQLIVILQEYYLSKDR